MWVIKLVKKNSMEKQTAVEWLGKELESYGDPQFCKIEWEKLDSLIQQAKEMEKEQIMQAFEAAEKYCGKDFLHGDLYYNETFKSE
jgi:hypothetical protein